MIADNARLFGDARRSLAAQVEANRRKDEFVATVSHELRTPLTVMLGAAQTLLRMDGRLGPDDRVHFLHTAIDQGWHLQHLIEDLLLIAASERGTLTCSLTTVTVAEIADDLLTNLPAGLSQHLEVRNTAGPATVATDRDRVRQIVANLLDNAQKYASGAPIELQIGANDAVVSIAVIDHGPGIPAEDREPRVRALHPARPVSDPAARRDGDRLVPVHATGNEARLEAPPGGDTRRRLHLRARHRTTAARRG